MTKVKSQMKKRCRAAKLDCAKAVQQKTEEDNQPLQQKIEEDNQSTSAGGSDCDTDVNSCKFDSDDNFTWESLIDCASKDSDDGISDVTHKATLQYDRNILMQFKLSSEQRAVTPHDLHTRPRPFGIQAPPGLELPTNAEELSDSSQEGHPVQANPMEKAFNAVSFRKELVNAMRDLSSKRNVGTAVRHVRDQCVPASDQADQFVDILTRAAEEKVCATRRLYFAFAAGLANAEQSAFEKSACIAGIKSFFQDVYEDLLAEVPRITSIVVHELLPPLRNAIPSQELNKLMPADVRLADSTNNNRVKVGRR